jgi:hypothetical protein
MAQSNSLNPFFKRVEIPCNALNAIITGGTAYDDTTIKADKNAGTPGTNCAAGSIYISGHATTPNVWIAVGTTWTKLTVN